jgi:hypothetical protein
MDRRWGYNLSRLQYFSKLNNFGKTWASRSNIFDDSASSSGISYIYNIIYEIAMTREQV